MLDSDKIMTLEEVAEYLRVKPRRYIPGPRRRRYPRLSWVKSGVSKNQ
jgi:hypothetical protein